MSGNRLSKRFSLGLGLLALAAGLAQATPVQPDVRKLLAEPQRTQVQFPPARAGWHGPEGPVEANLNPLLRSITPAATAKAVRASMLQVLVPDSRMLAAILGMIVILRRFVRYRRRARGPQLITLLPHLHPERTEERDRLLAA